MCCVTWYTDFPNHFLGIQDIFAKVDDPDEDQPAKISWNLDLDDDELEGGEDEDEELDDDIGEEEDELEPIKKKSSKAKKHTH